MDHHSIRLSGNNIGTGDTFSMSDVSLPAGLLPSCSEGDMHIENADGIGGLVFGVENPDDPMPNGTASMWTRNGVMSPSSSRIRLGTQNWDVYRNPTADEINKSNYHVRVELLEDGTMNFLMDNVLVGSYKEENFSAATSAL